MAKELLRLEHIDKFYGSRQILEDLNLTIHENEFLTLLGPSGCGKTTTLRLIGGFELPDKGRILFDGQDITKLPPEKRQVNTVFQKYSLFSNMDVAENIAFGLKIKGKSAAYIRDKIKYALKLVNLDGYEHADVTALSGGQQQRIAIARAVVNEPKVLLLDEPLSALDLKLRQSMQRELVKIKRELGITFIFVTHDQEEALEVADRVVVINQGRIEQQGTPQQVWDNPASPFVYGFLGDVNLFKGRANDGRVHLEGGTQLDIPDAQHADGAQAFAYVRPHDLEVERYSPGQAQDAEGRQRGMVVQLARSIVVGPVARLELLPESATESADNVAPEALIEAHISAQQFHTMGLREGETLVVTPRRAKVFLDEAAGI